MTHTKTIMNSMQRTLTALGQQEPDRVPLFLLTNLHGAKEVGLSIRDYYARAENVVEGQMRLLKKYRADCLYGFFHASIEVEAWGGSTLYLPDGPPLCGPPVIKRLEDIDTLKAPSVMHAPCLARVLAAIQGMRTRAGDAVPIVGVAISPFRHFAISPFRHFAIFATDHANGLRSLYRTHLRAAKTV